MGSSVALWGECDAYTIWSNFGEKGTFYTVNLIRTYKDHEDKYHNSDSFSGSELLRIAHLATRAYDCVSQLRQADKADLEKGGAA